MKRIITFVTAAALIAALLTGCRDSASAKPTEPEGQPWHETAAASEAGTQSQKPETETQAINQGPAETAPAPEDHSVLFTFTRENYPRVDGSTSMVPLGKAIASVLLGEPMDAVADITEFRKTTQSFRNLKDGVADILVVGEPQAVVFEEMQSSGFEFDMEEIATDALIFVVNADNPVDNLTTEQIRDIYSGKITNWKEVGGRDAKIKAFQRNEGAGSQALIKKHIMKDTPMAEPVTGLVASEMGELMEAVKSYDNSADAIGYSVYYYANDMKMAEGLKIISVDGVEPSAATIRSGEYPHLNACYCVVPKSAGAAQPNRIIYKWLMSDDGQRLVESMGYVAKRELAPMDASAGAIPDKADLSLLDNNVKVAVNYTYTVPYQLPEPVYTRLKEEYMPALEARNDYGRIYPYVGTLLFSDNQEGDYYQAGSMEGLFDAKGRLITDPVYADIDAITYTHGLNYESYVMPFYQLLRLDEEATFNEYDYIDDAARHYSFASLDGSVVSKEYGFMKGTGGVIVCADGYDSDRVDIYDEKGRLILTEQDILRANPWMKNWLEESSLPGIDYGEGYFSITNYDEAYFLDMTGKAVMGPFISVYPFLNGQAAVWQLGSDNGWSLIDTEGNLIIDGGLDQLTILENGNYAAVHEGVASVYDRSGKKLVSYPGSYINDTSYGFVIEGQNEGSRYFCDCDGKLLFEDPERVYGYGKGPIIYITGDDVVTDNDGSKDGTGIWLTNILTGKSVFAEGYSDAYPFYTVEGEADIPYMRVSIYREDYTQDTAIYDYDLKEIMSGSFYVNPVEDHLSEKCYVSIEKTDENGASGVYELYDREMKKVADFDRYPMVYGDLFMTRDDWSWTAADKNGNVVFRYSLVNSQGD